MRVYDKKDRRHIYVNKFGIISLYKYSDNYIDEMIIGGNDSVSFITKDLESGKTLNEKVVDGEYFISTDHHTNGFYEYRVNTEKNTIWKKKTIDDISYSEYYEENKLIESNIFFNVDVALINKWIKILNYERKEI